MNTFNHYKKIASLAWIGMSIGWIALLFNPIVGMGMVFSFIGLGIGMEMKCNRVGSKIRR